MGYFYTNIYRFCKNTGVYNIELNYTKPSENFLSGERRTAVDLNVIEIVGTSACADATDETSSVSEAAFGFQGLSAYEVWLKDNPGKTKEDYFSWLQKPATDIAETVNLQEQARVDAENTRKNNEEQRVDAEDIRLSNEQSRVEAEALRVTAEAVRVTAEDSRVSAETSRTTAEAVRVQAENERKTAEATRVSNENNRVTAEQERVNAESLRTTAESLRVDAEIVREQQEQDRQINTATAITNAETATAQATTAAEQADTARLAIQGDLALKADHGYSSNPKTLKQVDDEVIQLVGEVKELGVKDAVQGAKIREIENVLSTANLNQSAQLSVSGVSPLSLPKNAANGGMEVKLEGLTAENLVVNGDFRNGTDGWIHFSNYSTETIVDGNLRSTRNQNRPYFGRSITKIRLNDKIYYSLHIRGSKDGSAVIEFGDTLPTSEGGRSSLSPITTTFNRKTNIHTVTSDLTAFFKIDASVFNTSGDYIEIRGGSDGIKIINLTATFGAGNEPDLATCDAMFSDYFEGVKSFEPTGRIRSVGKNLFKMLTQTISTRGLTFEANKDRIQINGSVSSGSAFRVKISNRIEASTAFNNTWQEERLQLIDGAPYCFSLKQISGSYSSSQNVLLRLATSTNQSVNSITFPLNHSFSNSDQHRACLYLLIYPNTTFTDYEFTVQVEKGTVATPYEPYRETSLYLTAPELRSNGTVRDEIRKGANGYELVKRISDVDGSVLTTPEIIPISYGGILNSAENGTVYHEPIIADAGVYGTNMPILLPDYPISALEEIIIHKDSIDTYLDVSTAVIAPDGLSFTHPDLTEGDLVLFTYSFDKESTNGNITATFYDSNVVKIDTVTGKAYKIEDVVTNGVLTRTLTEV